MEAFFKKNESRHCFLRHNKQYSFLYKFELVLFQKGTERLKSAFRKLIFHSKFRYLSLELEICKWRYFQIDPQQCM